MDECVNWSGYLDQDGYGRQGAVRAHRVAYEMAKGAIPEGMEIDHLCRNRACVNPDHLEAVTHAENMRRAGAARIGRRLNMTATHCKQGHPFTPENTYYRPDHGTRTCRTCNREAAAAYKRRKIA